MDEESTRSEGQQGSVDTDWRNGRVVVTDENGAVLYEEFLSNCLLERIYAQRRFTSYQLFIPFVDEPTSQE